MRRLTTKKSGAPEARASNQRSHTLRKFFLILGGLLGIASRSRTAKVALKEWDATA
jgi:hypothetical protein